VSDEIIPPTPSPTEVAARGQGLTPAVKPVEYRLLIVAAWWHDLGYAPFLWDTGCDQTRIRE
jgi:hypothetical protein